MSSREARRASRGSARSRRTPVRATNTGFRLPWVPIIAILVVVVGVALVVFLITQTGGERGSGNEEAQAIEADEAPDLPGQYVDLPAIYDGCYHCETGTDTGSHVRQSVDYTNQGELPPAGGPHWGARACEVDGDGNPAPAPFCGPAPWGIFREPWEAGSLVHNMEHGGVVVWYNTSDQSVIEKLENVVGDKLNDRKLVVLTPYPDIAEDTIAMTSWARRDIFPVSEFTEDRVGEFIDELDRHFNPEDF